MKMLKKWRDARDRKRALKLEREQKEARARQAEVVARQQEQQRLVDIAQAGAFPAIDWAGSCGLDRLPFNFQKSERPFLVLTGIGYAENKARRRTVGKTAGASVRIAKGVSIRTGGYSGTPIHYEETVVHGDGIMAITNKHIYFSGPRNLRIPYTKIVAFGEAQEYPGCLKVTRDRVSGLPEFFEVSDEWIGCVLSILEVAATVEFGRREPEMRAFAHEDIHLIEAALDAGQEW